MQQIFSNNAQQIGRNKIDSENHVVIDCGKLLGIVRL